MPTSLVRDLNGFQIVWNLSRFSYIEKIDFKQLLILDWTVKQIQPKSRLLDIKILQKPHNLITSGNSHNSRAQSTCIYHHKKTASI